MTNAYYTVGIIAGTHGLRGEVKIFPKTDFPEKRFAKGSQLHLRADGQSPFTTVKIRQGKPHKQFWIVSFEGMASISDVEAWKGMQLCVSEEGLQPLPEGSYYIHQLVGLKVYTDQGTFVGDLVEVLKPGANDVYVVRGPLQKADVLIPAIPSCVQSVNLESGIMSVQLLPGLLDADDDGGKAD